VPTSLEDTGKQWDAPFAWAPIQYFAVSGLMRADFPSEANAAMQQWIAAVNAFFAQTEVLIEKYDSKNPTSDPRARIGYAQTQRGFGWTNAVYMLFVNRLYQQF
jgi:alpha,alpha-trehalase